MDENGGSKISFLSGLIQSIAVVIVLVMIFKNRNAVAAVAEVGRRVAGVLGWSKGFSTLTALTKLGSSGPGKGDGKGKGKGKGGGRGGTSE